MIDKLINYQNYNYSNIISSVTLKMHITLNRCILGRCLRHPTCYWLLKNIKPSLFFLFLFLKFTKGLNQQIFDQNS